MTLSRQFLIIITTIFITVFVSNFVITMQNTKEYIEEELSTKAQDAATSLGMLIKPHISNKKDAEIELIIKAVSDSGFYNEIRLEDAYYSFSVDDIAYYNRRTLDKTKISNIRVESKYGKIELNDTSDLESQLNDLENLDNLETTSNAGQEYTFIPSKHFTNNQRIKFTFDYLDTNNQTIELYTVMKLSNVLIKKVRSVQFDSVPDWFVDFIQFDIDEQQSEISDAWKVSAVIFVKPNPGIAYDKLYKQFTTSIISSFIIFIVFVILIVVFIKLLLNPLKEIEKVTAKIATCEFEKVKKIPWTQEFKSVALAINNMSSKLENIITKLNENIKLANKKLSEDSLTKLEMKESFETDMKKHFINKHEGYVILLKISDLTSFAKTNGRMTVNDFIVKFSNVIKNISNGKGYRFFGSEFMFVVHSIEEDEFKKMLELMKERFEQVGDSFDKKDVVHMGVSKFDRYSTIPSVLSSVSEAYSMAKLIGDNNYFIKENDSNTKGALEWVELINDVIENKNIKLNFIAQTDSLVDQTTIMVEAFSQVLDKQNEPVPIGMFISLAEENEKIIDFDKIVFNKVLTYIKDTNLDYKVAINLSITSMLDLSFLSWIEIELEKYKGMASKIIFSASAFSINNHYEEFKKFTGIVNQMGIEVMIKRYESKFIDTDQLKFLKPNIIRLAKSYTEEIDNDDTKLILVDTICNVSNILDIKVIAEGTDNITNIDKLSQIGVHGVSK
jgi:EAL domain-containing protein (putative c-di-GMP-specific phosphodiesterase class I)